MHLEGLPKSVWTYRLSRSKHSFRASTLQAVCTLILSGELKPRLHRLVAYWPLRSGAEPHNNEAKIHVLTESAMLQSTDPGVYERQ